MLICSLPVVIHLFPWSSFLHTLGEFKHGYIFHINNLNSKSCAFSNIHQTSTPFYTHNIVTMSWINKSFVCLHLYDCCVLVQSYVLSILMNFKLVEVKYFCLYIHLYAYTVRMKTLTALQRTFHECLNTCKTMIPKSVKWGFSDKILLSFTWWVFSPPYKAPSSTPPGFCSAILLFHLLFLLPLLDMFRKWIQSIMWHTNLCLQWE